MRYVTLGLFLAVLVPQIGSGLTDSRIGPILEPHGIVERAPRMGPILEPSGFDELRGPILEPGGLAARMGPAIEPNG